LASYAAASRLSYALWDAPPGSALLDASAATSYRRSIEITAQAEPCLRRRALGRKRREFLLTWLRTDRFAEMQKDAKRFPGFDTALASDLRTCWSCSWTMWYGARSPTSAIVAFGRHIPECAAGEFFGVEQSVGSSNSTFTR